MEKKFPVRNIILRLVLAMIFSVMAIWGYQINAVDSVAYFKHPVLFIVVTAAFFILILVIDKLLELLERSKDVEIFGRNMIVSGTVIMVVWVFVWLALFPGLAIYDGPSQLAQFNAGNISTHHPYIHSAFLGMCDALARTFGGEYPFYNALIQLILQFVCYMRLLFVLRAKGCKIIYFIYIVLFMAFYPANIFLALTTTKDAIFLDFFLLMMCEISLIYDGKDGEVGKWVWIRMAVFGILMTWFRNNGVYAFAVAFPFVMMIKPKKNIKRSACVYVAVIAGYLLYAMFVSNILHIKSGDSREAMSSVIQPVSRILHSMPGELPEDERQRILRMFGGRDDFNYVSYCSDYSKDYFDSEFFMDEFDENMGLVFKLFRRYPTAFFDAWLATNLGNYYPLEGLPRPLKVYYEIPLIDEGHSLMPKVYDAIADFAWNSSYNFSKLLTIYLNSGTTLWKLLYVMYYIVRKKTYRTLSLCMMPLMMIGTLLLAAGTVIRYTQPITICIPLILVTAMNNTRSKEEHE